MPDSPIIHKETLHELLVGVGRTIAETTGEQLKDAIEALREDRDDRHSLRNAAETALSTSAANKIKIESLEQRLLGDGTGMNGYLAELASSQREVAADVKLIMAKLNKIEPTTEESKSWMSGGKGLVAVLGAVATLLTILGGLVAGVLYVAHMPR